MSQFQKPTLNGNQKEFLLRFRKAAVDSLREEKTRAVSLAMFLVAVVLLQLLLQVLLNVWNRDFFDALERKDGSALWDQARLFVVLAAASIFLAATSVWGRMTAQRGWREALTHHVVQKWLKNNHFRQLNRLTKGTENPEYRIAVDIRVATDAPIDLALALLSSVLTALTFFSVLWTIGGSLEVTLFGMTLWIPGYLVFGVIVYSSIMSALMNFFGRHLTSVIERTNQTEAEFRAAVDAVREPADEPTETTSINESTQQTLRLKLQVVLLWWREFCRQLVGTTLVSHGNSLLAPVVGWFMCAPKYLSGAMTLGELTQAAAAFVVVQSAFNWLVDNYQRLADWRSSAYRVATLLLALDELEAKEPGSRPAAPPA